jgi:hypothetical protein
MGAQACPAKNVGCLVSGRAADRRTIIGRLMRTKASLRVDRGARDPVVGRSGANRSKGCWAVLEDQPK